VILQGGRIIMIQDGVVGHDRAFAFIQRGISGFRILPRFGSFSAWAANGVWLITTNLPALVWITMLMFCTTSAENMAGLRRSFLPARY
jgi:hypothetical protein